MSSNNSLRYSVVKPVSKQRSLDPPNNNEHSHTSARDYKKTHDRHIASLYPVSDNYILEEDGTKTPKSLAALATEAFCRSLVHLNGSLPPGLPPDVVADLVESLYQKGAWNTTTLAAFRKCELERLDLSQCRGVTDKWLEALMNQNEATQPEENVVDYSDFMMEPPESPHHQFMDVASTESDGENSTTSSTAPIASIM